MPDQSWTSQNFVLNATYTFRPNLLATFVGSISRRTNSYTGSYGVSRLAGLGRQHSQAGDPGLQVQPKSHNRQLLRRSPGTVSTPSPPPPGNIGTHWTYIKGGHTLEFGADMIKSKVIKNQDFLSDGSYTFSGALSGDNALDFLLSRPSSFTQREGYYYAPARTLPGAYFSDTWKVSAA